ncbi:MAG: sulfatase [Planctomycetota bacterium]
MGNSRDLLPLLAATEARTSLGDDRRRAVVLPAGTALSCRLGDLEPGELRCSIGPVMRDPPHDRRGQLELVLHERGHLVLARRLVPVADAAAWIDLQVAIGRGARAAELELHATGADIAIASLRHVLRTSAPPRANVLLYVIDTLRPDHLSAYGYERPTAPVLEHLAGEGVLFTNAYSTAPWTRPATGSLLTSLYPSFHGAVRDRAMATEVTTIAERLRGAGLFTVAFVANGNVSAPGLNFEQGFERFVSIVGSGAEGHARSSEVNELVLPALEPLQSEAFFLYVHAIDPHAPYDAPAPYCDRFARGDYHGPVTPARTLQRDLVALQPAGEDLARVRDLYDQEIAYQDAMLGALLDRLEELGLSARTIVVVTSDHGEEFAEHGSFGHGRRLWEEQIRVPLVLRGAGIASPGARIGRRVSLLDVVPTLLALLGVGGTTECQGHDLTPLLCGGETALAATEDPLYCEERVDADGERQIFSMVQGPWKLILRQGKRELPMLFNLSDDPGEQHDLASADPVRGRALRDLLTAFPDRFPQPRLGEGPRFRADETTRRQLEALGYAR